MVAVTVEAKEWKKISLAIRHAAWSRAPITLAGEEPKALVPEWKPCLQP